MRKNKINDLLKYRSDRKKFISLGGSVSHQYPVWSDYRKLAGSAGGDYFHQDLLVASFIYEKNPRMHIDIGSRIDGFVAHVAAFREIMVLDIRPLNPIGHSNIQFVQVDIMGEEKNLPKVDSVSCLHAIEHFGLGRYGDPIDPLGHQKGFKNLIKMLENDGILYLSFPIGNQNEVHFNAHRVFHPRDVFSWKGSDLLKLLRFDYVDDEGKLHKNIDLKNNEINVKLGCGIYTFKKINEN